MFLWPIWHWTFLVRNQMLCNNILVWLTQSWVMSMFISCILLFIVFCSILNCLYHSVFTDLEFNSVLKYNIFTRIFPKRGTIFLVLLFPAKIHLYLARLCRWYMMNMFLACGLTCPRLCSLQNHQLVWGYKIVCHYASDIWQNFKDISAPLLGPRRQ